MSDGGGLLRARQIPSDRVEQGLHALVAVGRAHGHGNGPARQGGATDRGDQGLGLDVLVGEEGVGDGLVDFGQRLDQGDATAAKLRRGGPGRADHGLAVLAFEADFLAGDEVDHGFEVLAAADGCLQHERDDAQARAQLLHHPLGVGPNGVHFVDERNARDGVAIHLAHDGAGLGLHSVLGTEHQHGAVEHPERTLDLDGEVDVSRRIDERDDVLAPLHAGGRRLHGDAPATLDVQGVHQGSAAGVVDLLHAVDSAAIEEDPFGEGGLARVDVGADSDVSLKSGCHECTQGDAIPRPYPAGDRLDPRAKPQAVQCTWELRWTRREVRRDLEDLRALVGALLL